MVWKRIETSKKSYEVLRRGNEESYEFIQAQKLNHIIVRLCRVLDIPRSSYDGLSRRRSAREGRERQEVAAALDAARGFSGRW